MVGGEERMEKWPMEGQQGHSLREENLKEQIPVAVRIGAESNPQRS